MTTILVILGVLAASYILDYVWELAVRFLHAYFIWDASGPLDEFFEQLENERNHQSS